MKYFSMFSGVGGFELGISRAVPLAKCIGYSEIDDYAIKTYEDHFNDHKTYGDITAIDASGLPDFDLLVGGFPCQAFSVAGKRLGFNETRGTLFFDIARILSEKKPRHLVLENVKGLLSHDGGRTFTTILGVLTDLGYCVEWQVLNSKDFGVPQNRERVYIVGHLGNGCSRQVFPISGKNQTTIKGDIGTIAHGKYRNTKNVSLTITANYWKGPDNHGQHPMVISAQPKYGNGQRTMRYKLSNELPTIRATQHKSGDNQANKILQESRIRRLTPTECERLQGFPDGWTIGSDTQRYKQCGNAVTVNVVQAVMERLCS